MKEEINHIYADVDGTINVDTSNKDFSKLVAYIIRSVSEQLAKVMHKNKTDIIRVLIDEIIDEAYKGGDESE